MSLVYPIRYIPKIASAANMPSHIQNKAILIVKEAKLRKAHVARDPVGFAAASLYLVCVQEGHNVTQKCLACAADVSKLTIRKRYSSLGDSLHPITSASE